MEVTKSGKRPNPYVSVTSKYSDALRTAAMAFYDADGRVTETCKAFGIGRRTLEGWLKERKEGEESGELMVIETDQQLAVYKRVMSSEVRTVMAMALDQVKRKLPEASAAQAATIYGILYDKLHITETGGQQAGNTTNNLIIQGMDRADVSRLLERTVDRLKAEAVPATGEVLDPENGD